MPTMTNPNPCIGSAVLDNATDGSALFRALGGHYTSPAQAVCEFIDDSLSSIAANGDEVGEVFLRVTDRGELVELSVTDSGSGIADLGAALTISDRSVAQTPYNEHGCGLKSALSHLCGGAEDWSIETRTADDAAADRYRCVSAPYAAVNAHMTERIYAGSGDIPWVTGTIVRLRCPMPRFAQLKPASRRTPADFCQLVDYLAEELRYLCARSLSAALVLGRVCARRCAGARGRTDRLQAPARGHPAGAPDEQLVRSHRQAVPHHLADLAAGGDRRMRPYPVIDPRATGENILRRRRELGYSVLDVQKYLNLACPQAVYHWQKGRALPSLDNFFALSLMLDTTVNELIAEHKEV